MPIIRSAPPWALALLLATGLCAPVAVAAQPASGDGAAQVRPAPKKAKKKAARAGKATFDRGSGETAAERDRRLRRECKGRPNAGACLGYGE